MKYIIGIIGLTVLLASCSDHYYYPVGHNVPNFKQKGEMSIGGIVSYNGQELQGAYAVSERFTALVNLKNIGDFGAENDRYEREKYGEIGMGYYKALPDNHIFNLGFFGGVGSFKFNGWNTTDGPFYGKQFETINTKFTIQPSISKIWKGGEAILSLKLTNVNFHNPQGRMHVDTLEFESFLDSRKVFFLLEPAGIIRLGRGPVRFQVQAQVSRPLVSMQSFPFYLSCGLNIRFKNKRQ